MKTLTRKIEILTTAFFFSILLSAQTPELTSNSSLSNTKKLNSSTVTLAKSKSDKAADARKPEKKNEVSYKNKMESELNAITQQISETVKFKVEPKISSEVNTESDENLNKITDEIGESIKYQPISSL